MLDNRHEAIDVDGSDCRCRGSGALYGAAVEVEPRLRAASGVPFGLAVWALADEGVVPALGLKRSLRDASPQLHAYSLLSHIVYGATTELVRRSLRAR